jgi:hypothetical protein
LWAGFSAGDANWSVLVRPLALPEATAAAYEDIYQSRRRESIQALLGGRLQTTAAMSFTQVEIAGEEGAWFVDDYHLGRRRELYFRTGHYTVSLRAYPDTGEPFPYEDLRDIGESLRVFAER